MLTNMNFLNMGEHTTVRLILVSTMLVVLMRILNFILWPAIKKKKKHKTILWALLWVVFFFSFRHDCPFGGITVVSEQRGEGWWLCHCLDWVGTSHHRCQVELHPWHPIRLNSYRVPPPLHLLCGLSRTVPLYTSQAEYLGTNIFKISASDSRNSPFTVDINTMSILHNVGLIQKALKHVRWLQSRYSDVGQLT